MDASIRAGDVVVCRVNGTSDLYVIGTVATGTVGEFSLAGVTTIVRAGSGNRARLSRPHARGARLVVRGTASGYVRTNAPRGQLYHA